MSEVWPDTTTLSVLTFNCWGIPLPFVCRNYKLRMEAISKALFSSARFDIICLQEIWGQELFEKLQEDAKELYRYSHYFYSGVLGSGVCVFSRYPIVEALFHKWQVNGYMHKIYHGDWYGGKGIGLCRLKINGYIVNVYTCHTHADYNSTTEYLPHQVVQAFDVAQFIHVSSRDADVTILAGDLNAEPDSLCYRIIKNYANLQDSFKPCTAKYDATFACPTNSYHMRPVVKENPEGQRIDYIMYNGGKNVKIHCRAYCTPFEDRVPNQNFSYSDHEAIAAILDVSKANNSEDYCNIRRMTISKKPAEESISEAYDICIEAEKRLKRDICLTKWSSFTILIILLLIFYWMNQLFVSLAGFILLMIVVSVLAFMLIFSIYLWKRIERNGILCASKEMKICLDNILLDGL